MFRGVLFVALLGLALGAVRVQVFINEGDRPTPVVGDVVDFDDTTLTLTTQQGETTVRWSELTPTSAFTARMRVEPPESARQWLALGEFGWALGAEQQAQNAFARAVALDDALANAVRTITDKSVGTARSALPETTGEMPEAAPAKPVEPVSATVSPELAERWAATIREDVEELRTEIDWHPHTFETAHCLVFTDWPAEQHAFMARNLEAAYASVCQLFEIPLDQQVLVGKLPIYMFETREKFREWGQREGLAGDFANAAGLYRSSLDGRGMLVMWKPEFRVDSRGNANQQELKRAEDEWAAVLTHEFCHGFIHRYRTNRMIPNWLNEGTAEVVRHALFPNRPNHRHAVERAQQEDDFGAMFAAANIDAEDYAVAHTMVELLIRENPQGFRNLIHRIKDGEEAQAALQAEFGVNYAGLEAAWRRGLQRR